MGWPKGMPRKGHINKDGTVHAKKGAKMARIVKVSVEKFDAAKPRRGRPPKDPNRKVWNTPLTNKGFDPCPNCDFPEAYGGFCNECGWMEPLKYGRVA